MIKFLFRFISCLFIWLLVCIPLQLVGSVLLLILCCFFNIGKLPRLFRWFDSADPFVGRDTSVIDKVSTDGWYARYTWLAWRNPLNYFGYKVLGFQSKEAIPSIAIGNTSDAHPGKYYLESQGHYEYCLIHLWSPTKCFRFRMGHKLNKTKVGDWVQRVGVIQPYIDFSGKL
jgi:hypothetical protein